MMYVFGTLLTAGARLNLMNKALAFTVVINLVLLLVLIPLHGAVGAATATLVTQSGVALTMIILAFRVMPVRLDWKELRGIIGFLLVMTGLVLLPPFEQGAWTLQFGVILLIGLAVAASFGLLPLGNLFTLLRSRSRA